MSKTKQEEIEKWEVSAAEFATSFFTKAKIFGYAKFSEAIHRFAKIVYRQGYEAGRRAVIETIEKKQTHHIWSKRWKEGLLSALSNDPTGEEK